LKKKTRSDLAMEKPSHPSLQATTSVAERTCKPGSVVPISRSRRKRATISLGRRFPATSSSRPGSGDWAGHPVSVSQPNSSLLGLAPDGVYRARPVTRPAGELLPHRFTLTARCAGRRSAFCCTFPGLTAGGRYPPSHPVEPGLSSASRFSRTRRHRTHRDSGRPVRSASLAEITILPAVPHRGCGPPLETDRFLEPEFRECYSFQAARHHDFHASSGMARGPEEVWKKAVSHP
jgi:hypothetical protein